MTQIPSTLAQSSTSARRRLARLAPGRRSGVSNFKLEISNLKSKISNLKFQLSDLRVPVSNFRSEISNFKFQISNPKWSTIALLGVLFGSGILSSCGYHVGGTGALLPPGLKVIAVPALKNDTPTYRIEQRMTEAVVHEFLARTKYRIVSSPGSADAVLRGEITSFEAIPAVFDTTPAPTSSSATVSTTTARATTMLVTVHMKVLLEQTETNKTLYKNDNYLFRQPYEISTDPAKLFDEQGPALQRISRDFAARLVSDVLENF
jgi:hypothetical protein